MATKDSLSMSPRYDSQAPLTFTDSDEGSSESSEVEPAWDWAIIKLNSEILPDLAPNQVSEVVKRSQRGNIALVDGYARLGDLSEGEVEILLRGGQRQKGTLSEEPSWVMIERSIYVARVISLDENLRKYLVFRPPANY